MKINADKYYVVLESYEDEETGEFINPDDFAINNLKEYIREKIDTAINDKPYYRVGSDTIKNQNRSYPQSDILELRHVFSYYKYEVHFRFTLCVNHGYYDGGNLDYMFEMFINKD